MQHELIQYQGSYRYADRVTLEHAMTRARAALADDESDCTRSWLRCFVFEGTRLLVNLSVPAHADERFVAANLFLTLAHGALDGAVEARQGARSIDLFAPGDED